MAVMSGKVLALASGLMFCCGDTAGAAPLDVGLFHKRFAVAAGKERKPAGMHPASVGMAAASAATVAVPTTRGETVTVALKDVATDTGNYAAAAGCSDGACVLLKGTPDNVRGWLWLGEDVPAYRYSTVDGVVVVEATEAVNVVSVCAGGPAAGDVEGLRGAATAAAEGRQPGEESYVGQDLRFLQSRPGAAAVFFLDFGPFWVDRSVDDSMSFYSKLAVYENWAGVAAAFSMYDVNVVMDKAVYDSAGAANGLRACFLDEDGRSWASFDSFGVPGCGSWNYRRADGKGLGMTTIHEIGHQLGLRHDGDLSYPGGDDRIYFDGLPEFRWVPYMGNHWAGQAWGKDALRQWSRGAYTNATNTWQDDFVEMEKYIRRLEDDMPGAVPLVVTGGKEVRPELNRGQIETSDDSDSFVFTVSGTTPVSLVVDRVGGERGVEGPMLDVDATLVDASGAVVAHDNPVGVRHASIVATLQSGEYALVVRGGAEGTPEHGFSNYSSLGRYAVEGWVGMPPAPPSFCEEFYTASEGSATRLPGQGVAGLLGASVYSPYNTGSREETYLPNTKQCHLIRCAGVVEFEWTRFDTEAGYDFVELYAYTRATGEAAKVAEHSGASLPGNMRAMPSAGDALVYFRSDHTEQRTGFNVNWRCGAVPTAPPHSFTEAPPTPPPTPVPTTPAPELPGQPYECRGGQATLNGQDAGPISFPSAPPGETRFYPNSWSQCWHLTCPAGSRVAVKFSYFDTREGDDFVQLLDVGDATHAPPSIGLPPIGLPAFSRDTVLLDNAPYTELVSYSGRALPAHAILGPVTSDYGVVLRFQSGPSGFIPAPQGGFDVSVGCCARETPLGMGEFCDGGLRHCCDVGLTCAFFGGEGLMCGPAPGHTSAPETSVPATPVPTASATTEVPPTTAPSTEVPPTTAPSTEVPPTPTPETPAPPPSFCESMTVSDDTAGSVAYPASGNYPHNENVCWKVRCAGEVTLSWSRFRTESGYDSASLYMVSGAGDLSRVWKRDGTELPVATSHAGDVLVHFESDHSVNDLGIAFAWECGALPPPTTPIPTSETPAPPPSFCESMTVSDDTAGSVAYPASGNYPHNENVCWKVRCAGEVTLSWSRFRTESGYDFASLYMVSGAGDLSRVWKRDGTELPVATSHAGDVLVHFESDYWVNDLGIAFAWECTA